MNNHERMKELLDMSSLGMTDVFLKPLRRQIIMTVPEEQIKEFVDSVFNQNYTDYRSKKNMSCDIFTGRLKFIKMFDNIYKQKC